jgi:hypothetical protein
MSFTKLQLLKVMSAMPVPVRLIDLNCECLRIESACGLIGLHQLAGWLRPGQYIVARTGVVATTVNRLSCEK